MIKRLTAILLILAFGAGVASGAPLRTGREDCHRAEPVETTEHCAKLARSVENTPEVQAARLCCALNCQNGGAGGPASAARVSGPQAAPAHPAAAQSTPHVQFTFLHRRRRAHNSRANESPPAYLLNLAFLI